MRFTVWFLILLAPLLASAFKHQAQAAPAGLVIKRLYSLVKWTRPSTKSPHQSESNVLQFEDGYLVETVAEGNDFGVVPHSIRASQDGELFAVDAINSNIVRITPPLSRYSRSRLVAGSFQGLSGYVDGKPSDARFNHPRGVAMDDKGNVYVADTSNLAIRKIGEAGVTTIAGGKSNVAGYTDGPSEDAKFSSDFDVVYVRTTCSLLVIDRGNAALRQISLNREDCGYENQSFASTDLLLVAGAILLGYILCQLQQGFGSYSFAKMEEQNVTEVEEQLTSKDAHIPSDVTIKDDKGTGWPSLGQLFWDLTKVAPEALSGTFFQFIRSRLKGNISKEGLTPLKDSLVMPEDEQREPLPALKRRTPSPLSETRQQAHAASNNPLPSARFSEVKPPKMRSSSLKDPALSSKHRSSRRQEYAEFYGSGDVTQHGQVRSKGHKDRSKHRPRDKNGDASFGVPPSVSETKPVEDKATSYDSAKYPYNFRSKYSGSYHFD